MWTYTYFAIAIILVYLAFRVSFRNHAIEHFNSVCTANSFPPLYQLVHLKIRDLNHWWTTTEDEILS